MRKSSSFSIFFLVTLVLGALPVLAQDIPMGDDVWSTQGGGESYVTIAGVDLDSICGATGNNDTVVALKGVNLSGQGTGDIVIARTAAAIFPSDGGPATVDVQVKDLHFASIDPIDTTCGALDLDLRLHGGQAQQPTTPMTITREDGLGGTFDADLDMVLDYTFSDANGDEVGTLPPTQATLGNPPGGTPWSYNPPAQPLSTSAPWYPGVTKSGARVDIWRFHQFIVALHAYALARPLRQPCATSSGGNTGGTGSTGGTAGQNATSVGGGAVGDVSAIQACPGEVEAVVVR
jgi:hypothetical protein